MKYFEIPTEEHKRIHQCLEEIRKEYKNSESSLFPKTIHDLTKQLFGYILRDFVEGYDTNDVLWSKYNLGACNNFSDDPTDINCVGYDFTYQDALDICNILSVDLPDIEDLIDLDLRYHHFYYKDHRKGWCGTGSYYSSKSGIVFPSKRELGIWVNGKDSTPHIVKLYPDIILNEYTNEHNKHKEYSVKAIPQKVSPNSFHKIHLVIRNYK